MNNEYLITTVEGSIVVGDVSHIEYRTDYGVVEIFNSKEELVVVLPIQKILYIVKREAVL